MSTHTVYILGSLLWELLLSHWVSPARQNNLCQERRTGGGGGRRRERCVCALFCYVLEYKVREQQQLTHTYTQTVTTEEGQKRRIAQTDTEREREGETAKKRERKPYWRLDAPRSAVGWKARREWRRGCCCHIKKRGGGGSGGGRPENARPGPLAAGPIAHLYGSRQAWRKGRRGGGIALSTTVYHYITVQEDSTPLLSFFGAPVLSSFSPLAHFSAALPVNHPGQPEEEEEEGEQRRRPGLVLALLPLSLYVLPPPPLVE